MLEPIFTAKLYPAVTFKSVANRQHPEHRLLAGACCSATGTALFSPCGRLRWQAEILEPLYSSLPSWLAPGRRTALYAPLTATGVSA